MSAHAQRQHARLGASPAKRWMACAGAPREIDRAPPQESSSYAEEGTRAHEYAEYCLRGNVNPLIGAIAGQVSEDMAKAVKVYTDTVAEYRAQIDDCILRIEEPVDLTWIHKDCWGTNDCELVQPFGRAVVIDYKHGAGIPVEAEDNPQLAFYALSPWQDYDVDSVEVVIVQPRCFHPDGPVRRKVYTRDELRVWAERFRVAAHKTDAPDAPLTAGEHCHWCPAAAQCPELARRTLSIAQQEFGVVTTPPAPVTLTPAQLRTVLQQADMIDAWVRAVRALAMSMAQQGMPPEGYKLVTGRKGSRRWIEGLDVASALTGAGVDPFERSLISPAAAEKLLGKKTAAAVLAPLVTQSAGKPELALEGDPRQAIAAGPAVDFDAVT